MTRRKRPSPGKAPRTVRRGRAHGKDAGRVVSVINLRWSGFRPMFDYWGNEIKRFYNLETLSSATEGMLGANDRFIIPSVQEVLGPSRVNSLSFELFQEGKYQLIFRLRAANAKRREATFAFVVAKNDGNFSRLAATEHANLRILNQRAPEWVVRPFRGGHIYLPDRHRRQGRGRAVYVYLTQWLEGFHELGVDRSLQFFINTEKPRLLTIAQTQGLKSRIVAVIARTYDAAKGQCMEIPQAASGDFVITNPRKGAAPKLKLIACRKLLSKMTPAKIIHRIVRSSWDWGGREFRLAPEDPGLLFEGLVRALGKEQARKWLAEYRLAVSSGDLQEHEAFPLEALNAF